MDFLELINIAFFFILGCYIYITNGLCGRSITSFPTEENFFIGFIGLTVHASSLEFILTFTDYIYFIVLINW